MQKASTDRGFLSALPTVQGALSKSDASMVMAVTAVHMLVRDFFARRGSHFGHLRSEFQRLTGQRMVAIQMHFGCP